MHKSVASLISGDEFQFGDRWFRVVNIAHRPAYNYAYMVARTDDGGHVLKLEGQYDDSEVVTIR